jgi:hypothetical protein
MMLDRSKLDVDMMLIDGCFAFVGMTRRLIHRGSLGMDEMDNLWPLGLNWFAPTGN